MGCSYIPIIKIAVVCIFCNSPNLGCVSVAVSVSARILEHSQTTKGQSILQLIISDERDSVQTILVFSERAVSSSRHFVLGYSLRSPHERLR